MAIDTLLIDHGEEIGEYILFDIERENLIIYNEEDDRVDVDANTRMFGLSWIKVRSKFSPHYMTSVPEADAIFSVVELFDKNEETFHSADDDDRFYASPRFFDDLRTFADMYDANIIRSEYCPWRVFEVHEINRLVKLLTSSSTEE